MTCELCSLSDPRTVRSGLALYEDGHFERMDRCTDHQSCRDRLEEAGGVWPLQDITHSKEGRFDVAR